MAQAGYATTVVIPAHDEEAGLRRLLPALLSDAAPGEFRILVMCNGCTDGSAAEAARHGPDVEVFELPVASKAAALDEANRIVADFPVVYIDADVLIDTESLRSLTVTLERGHLLATAPERHQDREGVSRAARWYYDIWERLPQVREGLFGRGVIALSRGGFERVAALPRYRSDDLAYSEAFAADERAITTTATVTVWPARTWRALVARRVRVIRGTRELRQAGGATSESATAASDLIAIARREPRMAIRLPVFVLMTLAARLRERTTRSTASEWLRDESSRTA
ncbi:glycosyltransferase [Leifsonia sp. 2MCAF36]|uniref:glycosyltransferase n=1 Tax=Leifsonia sp. 2MCAF36 TaxID=3232988 RepID=UPI003F94C889